jgi:hypothetical protein
MHAGVEIQVSEMNPRLVQAKGVGVTLEVHPENVVVLRE